MEARRISGHCGRVLCAGESNRAYVGGIESVQGPHFFHAFFLVRASFSPSCSFVIDPSIGVHAIEDSIFMPDEEST